MNVLTEIYQDSSESRQKELLTCIERNLSNKFVESVHLFGSEDVLSSMPANEKLVSVPTLKRATYKDFFDYAATHLSDRRCALINTDIFFDDTLQLLNEYDLTNVFMCLTRWNFSGRYSVFFNRADSADTWIFKAPIHFNLPHDFNLGKPGCDNRIARIAHDSGYKVQNPSISIRTHHLHMTNKRNYTVKDLIPGPYLLHRPHSL